MKKKWLALILFSLFLFSCRIKHMKVYDNESGKLFAQGFVLISNSDSTDIGRWKFYDVNGTRRESTKFKGKRYNAYYNGRRVIYYANGNKQFIEYYDRGHPIRSKRFFYENGHRKMIYKYNGKTGRHKSLRTYYVNGKMMEQGQLGEYAKIISRDSSGNILKDTLESSFQARIGKWTEYYSNGKKKAEGEYLKYVELKNDTIRTITGDSLTGFLAEKTPIQTPQHLKTGQWKIYNEQGKFIRNDRFYFGTLIR
jgi:antitoxin component YwqK of YwqJK toxin-antitoxin module